MHLTTRLSVLVAALLLCAVAMAADNVILTISTNPPLERVWTSRSVEDLSVTTTAGETVTLTQADGREYVLLGSGMVLGTQFGQVPARTTFVQLTPQRDEEGMWRVSVEVRRDENGRLREYASTVKVATGDWVQLWGPTPARAASNVKHYGADAQQRDALYLRVD